MMTTYRSNTFIPTFVTLSKDFAEKLDLLNLALMILEDFYILWRDRKRRIYLRLVQDSE